MKKTWADNPILFPEFNNECFTRDDMTEERERELHALADIRDEIDYKMESIIREARQKNNKLALTKSPTKK